MSEKNHHKSSSNTHSIEDVENAIEKLNGKDRIGSAGQILSVVGGAAAGGGVAGSIAAASGATTLLGSSTLASALGGVFVASTPVGWVVGCAIAGAATAYGISKMVKSGGRHDRLREEHIAKLLNKLSVLKQAKSTPEMMNDLQHALAKAVHDGHLTEDEVNRVIQLVESGKLQVDVALIRVQHLST